MIIGISNILKRTNEIKFRWNDWRFNENLVWNVHLTHTKMQVTLQIHSLNFGHSIIQFDCTLFYYVIINVGVIAFVTARVVYLFQKFAKRKKEPFAYAVEFQLNQTSSKSFKHTFIHFVDFSGVVLVSLSLLQKVNRIITMLFVWA